jgi:hypothetical protein
MDHPYKHHLIIPRVEMETNIESNENKELNDEVESECYYKVVNESVISSNDNNHEDDFEDSDENEDYYEDEENQIVESKLDLNENGNMSSQNILNKNTNKFFNLNRAKLVKSAAILRNQTDQFEIDNSKALSFIYKFSKKQRNKMEEMLPKVELKKYSLKTIPTNKFYEENERLGKLLESKNLRNKQKARSISNLEEYTDLFENDLIDDQDECVYTANLSPNKISLLDSQQRDITFRKLNSRTEKINFKKYVVKSMYKKSIDNQRKSQRYSANSLEKSLINNNQSKMSKKSIRYLDDEMGQVSTADSEIKKINKIIENNLNLVDNNNDVINRKAPEDYFPFKIATNKYNSKFEIFKPLVSFIYILISD